MLLFSQKEKSKRKVNILSYEHSVDDTISLRLSLSAISSIQILNWIII